ncbi:STAS-like domain-containing protein [Shewanella sp. S23-S33]|uniref:STAS-like domain-containing protein n=1 Tax=Shewanella TaxID=22 RepID=UPI001B3EF454|nr:STAS-like domain-containing protein [Saprospiraceae bacterium]
MTIIKVSERYPCPGPRYKRLGPASGEEFRDWIVNELSKSDELAVDLDGTEGYGSSFLEECFGGLIRIGVNPQIVKKIQLISTEEPELIDEINEYIEDAINGMKA